MISRKQHYQGCMLGLAVGDAIGTSLEFQSRGTFQPITDMVGGGPFDLQPGQWTDDTSMALCLAHSLLSKNGFDATDQMNRYCNWWQWGYLSSTGECFDIGATVLRALTKYLETKDPFSGSVDPKSAGNGSLMRLAPVPMYFGRDLDKVIEYSGESSRTTHACTECIEACRYFGVLLYLAFSGCEKEEILNSTVYNSSSDSIKKISEGKYTCKNASEIKGSGYVVESLEAALWCFAGTESFAEAVLLAANLGDDADTTAAICGQIAGAYYGVDSIPSSWIQKLVMSNEIRNLANSLLETSEAQSLV